MQPARRAVFAGCIKIKLSTHSTYSLHRELTVGEFAPAAGPARFVGERLRITRAAE
jgi:hypothetical protein